MDDNNAHILHALQINDKGQATHLEGRAISEIIKNKQLAWVHFDAAHPETRVWLESEVPYLDSLIIDALLADNTRPRIVEFEKGLLLILRGVNLNEGAAPDDMVSIRLWIDANRIISVRLRKLKAVDDIRTLLLQGKGPKNSADFLTALSSRLFERMEPVITALDERSDDIEEKILDDPDIKERQEIIAIRKQAITLRRYIAPQRDVLMHIRTCEMEWIDIIHKRRIQESYDRVTRYIEDLDMIRERSQIVKDELANALADRLNKNMYVLSVIAAIFLPLGFLTGLLGINVGGIPGADNAQSFMIFCGFLVTIVAIQVLIFKKMKWF
jgi:zinc transporter